VILIVLLVRIVHRRAVPDSVQFDDADPADRRFHPRQQVRLRPAPSGARYQVRPLGEPERGDVVVFRYPGYSCEGREERSGARCGEPFVPVPRQDYIKRVVGLPGDEVVYRNKTLYLNGKLVQSDQLGRYIGTGSGRDMTGAELRREQLGEVQHETLRWANSGFVPMGEGQFTVPAGHYFVMGDNRDNSEDSRFWGFVPENKLVGKAFLIWMNWDGKNGGVDFGRHRNRHTLGHGLTSAGDDHGGADETGRDDADELPVIVLIVAGFFAFLIMRAVPGLQRVLRGIAEHAEHCAGAGRGDDGLRKRSRKACSSVSTSVMSRT
jgi:signal peptidase I